MSAVLPGPFNHVGGACWNIALDPGEFPGADDPIDPSRSCLLLREDGRELGPPHTAHELLVRDGRGAYSHWSDVLWFSTSDNSDPNRNGRAYSVEIDGDRYFARRVDYAVETMLSWARFLPGGLSAFNGRSALEIGPGRDMGTVLLMAALGASRVRAVDRFTGAWRDGWHDRFIPRLKAALGRLNADTDPAPLDMALEARRLDVAGISFEGKPLEEIDTSALGFDVSVSHSTFEHFYSVEQAAKVLAALTAEGGVGVHNVDFRDHDHFADPLRFLLVDAATYADPTVNHHYGRGNRVRSDEMQGLLQAAGFGEVRFYPTLQADDDYLERFLHVRHASGLGSGGEIKGLRTLAGVFVLRK